MRADYIIRLETENDYRAAEQLTREAFWNVYRPGCLEHYVLHVLRSDPAFVPELSFVMERDGRLIGHVMYMRSQIQSYDGRAIPIMTFGPISIAPDCKRQGYGTILLRHSMEAAGQLGAGALAITGNIGFYGKSGFVVASSRGIHYFAAPGGGSSLLSDPGTAARLSGGYHWYLQGSGGLLCGRGGGGGL